MLAFSAQAFANPIHYTFFPSEITFYVVKCLTVGDPSDICAAATTGATITAPTSTTTIALLKEEVAQVEPDAYQFLAGEEKSLALSEVVDQMREVFPELKETSDEEIAVVMLQSVQQ